MEIDTLIVLEGDGGKRLDVFLASSYPEQSRHYFQHLISEKLVLVNGEIAKKSTKITVGDEIEVEFLLTPEISLEPEEISLSILYEDEDLIAIDKPAGMVVHPAEGNWSGTFVNALLFHCKTLEKGDDLRPGIVHRLDKETTGVLLAAKNSETQQKLVALFANREIKKEYRAITLGNPGNRTIEGNISRHPIRRKEMAVVEGSGKPACTLCETLAHNEQLAYVRLLPETGRTHQLRVHLKYVGTPILGDALYGNRQTNTKWKAERQLLHAYSLTFAHPTTGEEIVIKAPIPHDLERFIKKIERKLL